MGPNGARSMEVPLYIQNSLRLDVIITLTITKVYYLPTFLVKLCACAKKLLPGSPLKAWVRPRACQEQQAREACCTEHIVNLNYFVCPPT